MTAPLYLLEGVERRYERGSTTVHALRGVDLSVMPGELLAVEGPSGSGKSTLLQLLGAMDTPTAGRVDFDGSPLARASDRTLTRMRREAIGFVFQQFNLIPTLTAVENVEIAMAGGAGSRQDRRARATELLSGVGLGDRTDHLPSRLSGGEQQRVAIARALANGPRVVLADEPTGNLDSGTAQEVVDLLVGLNESRDVTIVVVTHDDEVAGRMRRRVRLRNGEVATDSGPPPAPTPSTSPSPAASPSPAPAASSPAPAAHPHLPGDHAEMAPGATDAGARADAPTAPVDHDGEDLSPP